MNSDDLFPHAGSPRRLAAILCADIVGYSRLMNADEEGTHARIKRQRREIIEPTVAEHYGRIVKNTGDGFLAVFDSPLEAVRCAIVIQQSMVGRNTSLPRQQWVQYRIGVNLGDVIVEPEDVYGDGVNIASRLETIAEPGSVNISGGVYEQIKNKLVCGYQSLGDEKLKNITDPVRIYRVLPDPASVSKASQAKRFRTVAAVISLAIMASIGWYGWYGWQLSSARQADGLSRSPPPMETAAVPPAVPAPSPSQSASVPIPAPAPPAVAPAAPSVLPVPEPQTSASLQAPQARRAIEPPPPVAPIVPLPTPEPPAPVAQPEAARAAPPAQVAALPPAQQAPDRPRATVPTMRDCPTCPELVALPGSTFAMGSNDDASERPVRTVSVGAFAIGRFPVTIGEWQECSAAKACTFEASGDPNIPVHNISWADAQQYVAWLSKRTLRNYRLPTEAEWEYAARAGTLTKYWWGNAMVANMANCRGCGEPYDPMIPAKVGSFRANSFGLHDMSGGVSQWVSDCWHRDYQGAPRDGTSWDSPGCREHVLRGGSWRNDATYATVTSRDKYDTGVRYLTHGLRVARSN